MPYLPFLIHHFLYFIIIKWIIMQKRMESYNTIPASTPVTTYTYDPMNKYVDADIRIEQIVGTMDIATLLEKLKFYGVGRRKLDDLLFAGVKPPPRLGVYDEDDEQLCHEIIQTSCNIPGCTFTAESLLEFENHYNASHRYVCSQCKKVLPSPHLLDLHIQENHDSFFAVMAERKPSYCCYIEECKEKFMNTNGRIEHCVREHKLPKDFRFEQQKNKKKSKANKNVDSMDLDEKETDKKVFLMNSKQKTFQYTGRKFTKNKREKRISVNMDDAMGELKDSLPE